VTEVPEPFGTTFGVQLAAVFQSVEAKGVHVWAWAGRGAMHSAASAAMELARTAGRRFDWGGTSPRFLDFMGVMLFAAVATNVSSTADRTNRANSVSQKAAQSSLPSGST
jgi:hypothetical protein